MGYSRTYGARWVSVPCSATATNLFANLCGQSETIKKSESIDGRNKREIEFLFYSHPRSPHYNVGCAWRGPQTPNNVMGGAGEDGEHKTKMIP